MSFFMGTRDIIWKYLLSKLKPSNIRLNPSPSEKRDKKKLKILISKCTKGNLFCIASARTRCASDNRKEQLPKITFLYGCQKDTARQNWNNQSVQDGLHHIGLSQNHESTTTHVHGWHVSEQRECLSCGYSKCQEPCIWHSHSCQNVYWTHNIWLE